MTVSKIDHSTFTREYTHPPLESQGVILAMSQGDSSIINHPMDATGTRVASVMEERSDLSGKYAVGKSADYKIELLGKTSTRVTKLSSGTTNIKLNILI